MSAESIATAFGQVNSIIDQTANSVAKIIQAKNQYEGKQPTVYAGAFGVPALDYRNYTSKQLAGIGLLVVVLIVVGYLVWKESNS